jgi:hypothetical protein
MNRFSPLLRRLTLALIRLAAQLLPRKRADWARAMHSELDRIDNDRAAFAWAFGCALVGLKERIDVMATYPKISRWILAPEMLLCFVPLTIGWRDGLLGSPGIVRYFLGVHGGTLTLIEVLGGVVLATVGPLGLLAAFRSIAWGRPIRSEWLRAFLVIGPLLYGLMTLVSRLAVDGLPSFSFATDDAFDFWSGILLLSILPALGATHMLRLFPPNPHRSPVPG